MKPAYFIFLLCDDINCLIMLFQLSTPPMPFNKPGSKQRSFCSQYFLLQCLLEEVEQEELLARVGGVVVEGEDDRFHELGGAALRHLKDELGQVGGVGLQQVEQVLVGLQTLPVTNTSIHSMLSVLHFRALECQEIYSCSMDPLTMFVIHFT